MSRSMMFTPTPKTLDHSGVFYKLVLKENKKRKTNVTSSSRAPQVAEVEEDEYAYLDDL